MARGFLLLSRPFVPFTASTMDPARPIAHLAEDPVALVARAAAPGLFDIRVDLGAPLAIDTAVLLACNQADTPAELQRYVDGSDYVPVTATDPTGALPGPDGRRHLLWRLSTPIVARYWRTVVTPPAGQPGEAARFLLGLRFEPERNFEFGAQRGARDLGRTEFGRRGALLRDRGRILRTLTLSWPLTATAEIEGGFLPLVERAGNCEFVLACLDPDPAHPERSRRLYFGPLQGDVAALWRVWNGWEHRVSLLSVV